jgi:hypothetical protein
MLFISSCNPSFMKLTLNLDLWSAEVIGNAKQLQGQKAIHFARHKSMKQLL